MTEEHKKNMLSRIIEKILNREIFYPILGMIAGIIAVLPLKFFYGFMSSGMILFYSVFYVVILERLNNFTFIEAFRQKSNHTAATLLVIAKVAVVYLLLLRLALHGETQLLYHMLIITPMIGWTATMVEKNIRNLLFILPAFLFIFFAFGCFNADNMLDPIIRFSYDSFSLLNSLHIVGLPLALAIFCCSIKKAAFADVAALFGFMIFADRICYA